MAKLNIHDLAKELKREESEIISLCSSKGMSGVTRATMLQDTMVEEVRKAFKKPAEPADAAADKDGAPKKKLRLLFHPENSTKPISKKKRPDSAKKPEGDKAEKSVDKQEKAAERTESTKPAEKAQEMAKTEAPKETMTRENTKNDRKRTITPIIYLLILNKMKMNGIFAPFFLIMRALTDSLSNYLDKVK